MILLCKTPYKKRGEFHLAFSVQGPALQYCHRCIALVGAVIDRPYTFPLGGRCPRRGRMRGLQSPELWCSNGCCAPYTTSVICSFLANASFSSRRSLLRRDQGPALQYCHRCVALVGAVIDRPPCPPSQRGGRDGCFCPIVGNDLCVVPFLFAIPNGTQENTAKVLCIKATCDTIMKNGGEADDPKKTGAGKAGFTAGEQ